MEIKSHLELLKDNVDLFCLLDLPDETAEEIVSSFQEKKFLVNNNDLGDYDVDYVEVSDIFTSIESRVKFMVELGIQNEFTKKSEDAAFVINSSGLKGSLVTQISIGDVSVDSNIRRLFFESRPQPDTIQQTLKIAVNLSRTGHKGEPVGALFVIGDEDNVLNHSRPLNYNPFGGADVEIGDDSVSASIGEYAKLDGAFVISDSGQIIGANRYMEPRVHDADVPSGLGARHMAASGITSVTDSVAIVVSETDQKIRCFIDGEIVVSSDPDEIEMVL